MTIKDFISGDEGRVKAKEILMAIINHQISQDSSIDSICEILRKRCGTFCGSDDVILFKVSPIEFRSTNY